MLKLILTAFAALIVFASPAAAQSNQQLSGGQVMTTISTDEFIAFMAEGGIAAQETNRQPGAIVFQLSIPDHPEAGVLYTTLRNCDDTVAPSRCTLVQPFGFFSAVGVTFQQINDFNYGKSGFATAMLGNNNLGILASKSYFNGGITKLHFMTEMALFFKDVNTVVSAIKPGVGATVSYDIPRRTANSRGAADLGLELPKGVDFEVNSVGANAPSLLPQAMKQYLPE